MTAQFFEKSLYIVFCLCYKRCGFDWNMEISIGQEQHTGKICIRACVELLVKQDKRLDIRMTISSTTACKNSSVAEIKVASGATTLITALTVKGIIEGAGT